MSKKSNLDSSQSSSESKTDDPHDELNEYSITQLDRACDSSVLLITPISFCIGAVVFLYLFCILNEGQSVQLPFFQATGNETAEQDQVMDLKEIILSVATLIGFIAFATFLLFCLFYYKYYRVIFYWLCISCICLLFFLILFVLLRLFKKLNLTIDWITIIILVWNNGFLGILSMFNVKKMPKVLNQFYMIFISCLVSVQFLKIFSGFICWVLLITISFWDLFAVLFKNGPLNLMIKVAKERNQPLMPAMIYSSIMFAQNEGDRKKKSEPLNRSSNEQSDRQSNESSNIQSTEPSNRQSNEPSIRQSNEPSNRQSNEPSNRQSNESSKRQSNELSKRQSNEIDNETSDETVNEMVKVNSSSGFNLTETGQKLKELNLTLSNFNTKSEIIELNNKSKSLSIKSLKSKANLNSDNLASGNFNSLETINTQPHDNQSNRLSNQSNRLSNFNAKDLKYSSSSQGFNSSYVDKAGSIWLKKIVSDYLDRIKTDQRFNYVTVKRPKLNFNCKFLILKSRIKKEGKKRRNSVKLGLGDFIFYSVLVGKSAQKFDYFIILSTALSMLIGLILTLILLVIFAKPMPALPLSIFIGTFVYVCSVYCIADFQYELNHQSILI